jgi:hypothetical protein
MVNSARANKIIRLAVGLLLRHIDNQDTLSFDSFLAALKSAGLEHQRPLDGVLPTDLRDILNKLAEEPPEDFEAVWAKGFDLEHERPAREAMYLAYQTGAEKFRAVIEEFIADIENTGGILQRADGLVTLTVDLEWIDLAETYQKACAVLNRSPMIDAEE